MKGYLTAREAAHQLGVEYFAFLKRCRVGTFPSQRVGRAVLIKQSDLDRALDASRQNMDVTTGKVLLPVNQERGG